MTSTDTVWTATDAAAATRGEAGGDWRAYGLSADIGRVSRGDLFIALPDGNGDGADKAVQALAAGAAAAVVTRAPKGADPARLLIVEDTEAALRALALTARRRCGARIIGVAGSSGRAATRRMLTAVLEVLGQTHAVNLSCGDACPANGAEKALSLAAMHAGCDYAVFDAGFRSGGDESFMTLAYPHILLTDVAPSLVPAVAPQGGNARDDIFRHVSPGSTVLVSRDNGLFDRMRPAAGARNIRLLGYGAHEAAEARLVEWLEAANGSRVQARILGQDISFTILIPGRAAVMQALGVLLAVKLAGGDLGKAAGALAAMPAAACADWHETVYIGGNANAVTLIDESRHSSPSSIRAAFKVLALVDPGRGGRRIAVLGDMMGNMKGQDGARLHADLALPLKAADVQLVYTCGPLMKNLYESLPQDQRGAHRETSVELAQIVPEVLTPGDVVMVKGSHESRMGVVVEALRALPEKFGRKKKS